ncbi:BON domain-containing protein [Massilia consociata]|uniref:BON domain-containing protein n=2 Tax=Massilia consociata TaxID=760117 RepID=A0ABV6FJJ4_9BURK
MLSATLVALGACSTDPNTRKVGVALSDTAISTRVKTALLGDPDVKGRNVNVETFRGTVQLSGFVDNPESVARAADIARRVDGVREVRNALIVK